MPDLRKISEVVGSFYPAASDYNGKLRRYWNVRTRSVLVNEEQLIEVARRVGAKVDADLWQVPGATDELLVAARPEIELIRLDDYHLVIRLDTAGAGCRLANAAMIGTINALAYIDKEVLFEDVQGLPIKYWKLLSAVRESIT